MGTRKQGALVRLTELAYEPASSLSAWMDKLTEVASTIDPSCIGAVGRILVSEPRRTLGGYSVFVSDPQVRAALREHEAGSQHREDLVLHGPPGLRRMYGDASEALRKDAYFVQMRQRFVALGVADMQHVTARDGGGFCVTLGILVGETSARTESARAWSMAAVHLATAFRLQRSALDLLAEPPMDGAILATDGRVVHAEGRAKDASARERLRAVARSIDGARARADEEGSDRALAVWRGLVDGTWSIVDRHDHDGRRYIVAVPNEVVVRDPTSLSSREAQIAALAAEGYSDKWIGYALGLSRTTVSSHLHSAMAKLGVPTRVALASAFRVAQGPASRD